MGLNSTEAIILRTYNLGEADKIAVCLTRCCGVMRGVAHGARRVKSRFGASLEPYTVITLNYFEKEGRELVSFRQAEILQSYFTLAHNMEAVATLAYISELTTEFSPPHEPNEKLFRLVSACLQALSQTPANALALKRYFEIWVLKLSGFWPDLRACVECHRRLGEGEGGFLNAEQRLRCLACSKELGNPLLPETRQRLLASQNTSPQEFANSLRQSSNRVETQIAQLIERLIERALERQLRTGARFHSGQSLAASFVE
jgi:DNA repair protein RecO (recombination protein O)